MEVLLPSIIIFPMALNDEQVWLHIMVKLCIFMFFLIGAPTVESTDTTHFICANLTDNFTCASGARQLITLHCNITSGTPTPSITWYHNGIEIVNDGISDEALIVNKTACDLLGSYQCVVKNEAGIAVLVHRVLPFGKLFIPKEFSFLNYKSIGLPVFKCVKTVA